MEVREPSAKYLTPQFKRTEAGEIPIDWIDQSIGEMAEVTSGGTPSRQVAAFWDGDIPWVTTAELDGGQVTEASQYITAAGLQNSAAKWLPAGTLLIALYGQGKTRGKCAVLRIAATTNQACAGIKLKAGVDGDFVRHNLAQRYDYIRSLSNGGSQENLSGEIVKKIRVGMPSTRAEQRAISDALTDADALIDSLEQLLTKKRQIKQGAMQELLTGKRRLPGFAGRWKLCSLGEVAKFLKGSGLSKSSLMSNGSRPCIHYGQLFTDYGPVIQAVRSFTDGKNVGTASQAGDVLMPTSDVTPNGLARASCISQSGVALGGDILVIRSDASMLFGPFLSNLIRSRPERVLELVTGSTVFHLYARDMARYRLKLPSVEEQVAIAQVFSDMEAEIDALNIRLVKARALKQAFAQALLTGRIRLI